MPPAVAGYYAVLAVLLFKFDNGPYQTMPSSGGFRGGALGASAPPAESMVKNINLPFFILMYGRCLFACSVSRVWKSAP